MATPKRKTKWTDSQVMVAARALLDDPVVGPVIKRNLGEDWKAVRAVRGAVVKMVHAVDELKG